MRSKSEVIERLRVSLRLLGRDENTQDAYCRVAAKYYDFATACPKGWSHEQKAEAYLTQRVTRDDVSASTQNHDLAALNALYAAYRYKLGNVDALRAKRPQYARHCPTTPEALGLLAALHDTPPAPVRSIALLLMATGLRIGEALSARLKDFRREGEKMHLVVRDPKQAHDRWVMLTPMIWPMLRQQALYAKHVFQQDQQRNPPLPLQVPRSLHKKYPRAPHSIGWAFMFPSPNPQWHERTAQLVRWHLPDGDVQKAFGRACDHLEAAGRMFARITPHHLRHWYGTHFEGDLRDLQELMGHKSLETTATYRHPQLDRARSPLEQLAPALALAS